ncbi:MAG: DUF429 domain-containing protein [Flavobacteriales bacterium]|nr:DUF429 domain-containing protein [Flavobacteriales bacterium]
MRWIGIDYGAKTAGTTCVAWEENNELHVVVSEKGEDTDAWLEAIIKIYKPDFICIDAPLSLPGGFYNKSDNFFYRKCDQELQAMSPMFLGGLTARAMRLAYIWKLNGISVYEVYPKGLVYKAYEDLIFCYKMKDQIPEFLFRLKKKLKINIPDNIHTWHQVDAILAWISGWRISKGKSIIFGQLEEGTIHV